MNNQYVTPVCEVRNITVEDILTASMTVEEYNIKNPLDKVGVDIFG